MAAAVACPDGKKLVQLVLGQISGPEGEKLAEHLEQCPKCAQSLQALPAEDTLVEAARNWDTVHDQPEADAVRRLVTRLRALNPAAHGTQEPSGASTPATDATEGVGPARDDDDNASLAPAQAPGELGRLGAYRVLKVLGVGGMGKVYLAEDSKLERRVALKVMKAELAKNKTSHLRFMQEARAAAKIEHDNIVHIYQVDEDRGIPYLAMQLLSGSSLEDILRRTGPMKLKQALRVGAQIADGLAAAHELGMIHRDIKPGNIWIETAQGGRVKILDFGLARSVQNDTGLTQTGAILGTPAYMPPEQARGEKVDQRCDIYSLGCVLYRMVTGDMPIKGRDTMAILMALALNEPTPPKQLNDAIPAVLNDLIMKILAKDPDKRPGTAKEVAAALRKIERGLGDGTKTEATVIPPQAKPAVAKPVSKSLSKTEANPFAELEEEKKGVVVSPKSKPPSAPSRRPAQAKQREMSGGITPRHWALIGAGLGGAAVIAAVIVILWPTSNGIVRIEINDPKIKVAIEGHTAEITNADTQPIKLEPGKHGIKVTRQDFVFDTASFQINKGDKVALKVEWLDAQHKLVITKDGKLVGELAKPPIPIAGGPPVNPPVVTPPVTQPPVPMPVVGPAGDGTAAFFNGKDLTGWNGLEFWSVNQGVLKGNTPNGLKFNTFLCSTKQYGDFELEYEIRLGGGQKANSGVQIRSMLIDPAKFVVRGPQVDAGQQFWGCLYDEAGTGMMKAADVGLVSKVVKEGDFNHMVVRCVGKHVTIKLNGQTTVDDDFPKMADQGIIAWQIHSGAPMTVEFRNIRFQELKAGEPPMVASADNVPPPGFTALFNGKDLTGWQGLVDLRERAKLSPQQLQQAIAAASAKVLPHWTVENGVLHYDGKANGLQTSKDYGNFELYVDWKIRPNGDSGIYLRGNPQVQIWDPKGNNNPTRVGSGGLYNNQKNPKDPLVIADKPIGEWNTFHIRMIGDKVTIKLNGVIVVLDTPLENYWERGKPLPAVGPIELQHHTDELWFKNIYIRELSPDGLPTVTTPAVADGFTPIFNGKDFTGWVLDGGPRDAWEIVDGAVVCHGKGSNGRGWMLTEKDYTDFMFRCQFRVNGDTDAGIGIRALPGELAGKLPIHLNVKLRPKPAGSVETGSLYYAPNTAVAPSRPAQLKTDGAWNDLEIEVRNPTLRVRVNGQEIQNLDLTRFAGMPNVLGGVKRMIGRIGLGQHTGEAQFRNIKVKDLAGTAPSVGPPATGYIPIFNGKDLTGWKMHPQSPGDWRVENGVLVGRGPKKNCLYTERGDYTDLHFLVECKINKGGNSGQQFRVQFMPDLYGFGYEVQIDNSKHGGKTGSLFAKTGTPVVAIREILVPVDTWFTQEVIAQGNHIMVILNGKKIVDYVDAANTFQRGHLALQLFEPETVVHFRRIEVKELTSGTSGAESFTPLFNGKDLTGWASGRPGGSGNWKVEFGSLTCSGPQDHLYSDRNDYGDFHLRAEVKINAVGNSGIYFRAAKPLVLVGDYEAQITNNPGQAEKTGSLYGLVRVPGILVPPDTWFTYEIIAEGNRIRLLVNGNETTSHTEKRPGRRARGHLALQHHDAVTQVHFRKIEIRELK